jgi:predicted ester cyclase
MPDIRHAVQETVSADDRVAARVVVKGTLVGDFAGIQGRGRRFEIDQVVFAHVREGLMVEVWEIVDSGALLRQLGAIA